MEFELVYLEAAVQHFMYYTIAYPISLVYLFKGISTLHELLNAEIYFVCNRLINHYYIFNTALHFFNYTFYLISFVCTLLYDIDDSILIQPESPWCSG